MAQEPSRFQRIRNAAQALWDESALGPHMHLSRLQKFAHFWILVGKSFSRNRCPVRASALAYATLLALIPMLAVGVSITTSLLQKQGEKPVREMIGKLVANVAPALDLEAKPGETPAGSKRQEVVTKITDFI